MRLLSIAVLAAAIFLASAARAHEGGVDFRGVVAAADAGHVAVRGADGVERRFAVTPRTRVTVGGTAAAAADLRSGQRVVVHASRHGDRLEADAIRAAGPKAKPRR